MGDLIMAIGDGKVVEFTKEAVKAYLDKTIRFFRKQRDDRGNTCAVPYIDAYQCVRVALFDEPLVVEDRNGKKTKHV